MRQLHGGTLDRIEKYAFIVLFCLFAWRMLSSFQDTNSLAILLYLADQFVVLVFLLLRRPSADISPRIGDWLVGTLGTLLAVFVIAPTGDPLLPGPLVVALMLSGFLIHLYAKLSLRRSFGVVAANRGVKVEGPYRLVRHPMYLGYMVSQAGLLSAGPNLTNGLIVAACWTLFVRRIIAEEQVLSRDAAYVALCEKTRWRLVPGLY